MGGCWNFDRVPPTADPVRSAGAGVTDRRPRTPQSIARVNERL